ncbi:MAG: SDR family oxidoreductase [Cytophagales bacterium]
MKKKVLITGSNGLLGQKLISLLREDPNYVVIATARGTNRFPDYNGYLYKSMDVCNRDEVASVVEELKPDYIVHTAAMTNVDQCETDRDNCWQLNVRSVEYLVEACRVNNVHFIHLSTDFIFDGKNGPYKEDDLAEPVSFYGDSKLAAERTIMKSTIKWAILRTVLVYGIVNDMSRSNIILWVKKSLEDGKQITVVNDQWRTPTLAEDLAMGCMLSMKNNARGIYNISGKDFLSPLEMAYKTADYFGLNKALITPGDSSTFKQPAQRPPKTGFIIDKAQKDLGYNPHSFEEGINIVASQLKELEALV